MVINERVRLATSRGDNDRDLSMEDSNGSLTSSGLPSGHHKPVHVSQASSIVASKPSILPFPPLHQLFATFSRIPLLSSSPTTAFLSSPQYENYILVHLNRMMSHTYFKPIQNQKSQLFTVVASRLRSSWITR
ncbi:unnamed protein product [Rhizoctonia solani]|uniref:Uncharacterized protein n=1 Tax=Rhizoctonia solani TaxID=456999 RepID=A0A8H3H7Y3_9AGAM|nr:unnamed protein product [Rhizoctonia solani]